MPNVMSAFQMTDVLRTALKPTAQRVPKGSACACVRVCVWGGVTLKYGISQLIKTILNGNKPVCILTSVTENIVKITREQ